jgi:Alcohol dehydrogenase GroES-like domain
MRGAVLYGPRDVRFGDRDNTKIMKPTEAIIKISAACVCGSDLWSYRGIQAIDQPTAMGHEYCGIVEEVGSAVNSTKPGQFVIGSFFASDNTCPNCRFGYPSSCQQRELVEGAQAPQLRVPLAEGTLVATPAMPSNDLIPSLLTVSDLRRRFRFRSQWKKSDLRIGLRRCTNPKAKTSGTNPDTTRRTCELAMKKKGMTPGSMA